MMRILFFITIIALFAKFFLDVGPEVDMAIIDIKHNIEIAGDEEYRSQVKRCLDVLALKSPNEYKLIENNIGIIAQNSKSGMRAWENPPRYQMSNTTAFYSVTWCASTIAHDAFHSFLYKENLPNNGARTPYEKWAGVLSEKKAIEFQLEVMQKIDGPKYEIDYLKSLDGTHGDTNGDGKLTKEDYKQRNW